MAVRNAKNSTEILELVLSNGGMTSINQKTREGETCLHYAARYPTVQSKHIIPLLLDNGANKSSVDKNNQTAEQLARSLTHFPTAELIK